ncbi:right-handed parallel beta-helix repeat-containing protein [Arthrobacter sp.]|uniref:right-handed parallel beta-helix repeat-containing protein n=1 Tax=Arthrobacter sp. TaxID=1667 RepID=UPI00339347AB
MTDGSTSRRRRPPVKYLAAGAVMALGLLCLPSTLSAPSAGDREDPTSVSAASAAPAAAAKPLVVSPEGSDEAAGTLAAPLRTVRTAVAQAASGQTIVLRAGSYHEFVTIPPGKRLILRSYPGEEVWLDGSLPVTGFTRHGSVYVSDGWTAEFDASPTYKRGAPDGTSQGWQFVNEKHPMAAHPDQVWIDDVPQRQVGSRSEVKAGTFYVDNAADRLYIGSNPQDRAVRASTLGRALSIQGAGSELHDVGIRRYATSVPQMGAVTVEAPNAVLDDVAITDNATAGLFVGAGSASLRNVSLVGNGMLGAAVTYADGLEVSGLLAEGNNTEHFNRSPVSGGVKVGRTRSVDVRDSIFRDNDGPGLWLDESVFDAAIHGNDLLDNSGHGLSLELSAKADVVNNVIVGNSGHGLKVNNTSDVRIWNNTISAEGRAINIVQDGRRASDPDTPGHDPRQPFPDPAMSWINGPVVIRNNIISNPGSTADCLLCVEDYSGTYSAKDLKVTALGNVYHRALPASPKSAVIWAMDSGKPALFASPDEFSAATGQELQYLYLEGADPIASSYRPDEKVTRRNSTVAQPLPPEIALLAGQPAGARSLGAFAR